MPLWLQDTWELREVVPLEMVEAFMAGEEARKHAAKEEEVAPRKGQKKKGLSFVRL